MKRRDPFSLRVASLQADGYGSDEQGSVLMSGVLAGEEVTVQPIARKRRRLITRAIDIHEASKDRVRPQCTAAALCGGCSLQHMAPAAHVTMKESRVRALLQHLHPGQWLTPLTANVWGYRRKARLGVRYVSKRDEVLVGFREQHGGFIVDTDRCWTMADPVGVLLKPLARLVESLSEPSKVPQIEVAVGDDKTALVVRHLFELTHQDRVALTRFAESHHVDVFLQPEGPETCARHWPKDSSDMLHYSVHDLDPESGNPDTVIRMAFHPLDFVQVNAAINRQLIAEVIRLLELERCDRVLDTFCGIGNITIPIGAYCDEVVGVESVAMSIGRARYNARLNHLPHVRFEVVDLYSEQGIAISLSPYNKVVLDPPRTGAELLCKSLADSDAETIVYVSCNPVTLARDANLLTDAGFCLDCARVVDMFPHTTHVESIARFTRSKRTAHG